MKKGTNKETVQGLLDNTWDSYPPEFYITFHWKNSPRQLETVINDTKFFNNIFFMKFEGSNKPKKIPEFPRRVGLQHFHERHPVTVFRRKKLPKSVLSFHTHTVLSNTHGYFRDENHVCDYINELLRDKKVRSLKKLNNKKHFSVVPFNIKRHGTYNSDECRKKLRLEEVRGKPYFDCENSDLLRIS